MRGGLHDGDALLVAPDLPERARERRAGRQVGRVELEGLAERVGLLERLLELVAGRGEEEPRAAVLGLRGDALAQGLARERPARDLAVRAPELEEDPRVALGEARRGGEAGRALVELTELEERRPEARVRRGLLGRLGDGLAELVGGLGVLPERVVGATEARVASGHLGIERERLLEALRARLPVPELRARLAQELPRLAVVGVELEGPRESTLRELPVAGPRVGQPEPLRRPRVVGRLLGCAGEAVGGVAEGAEREERVAEADQQGGVLGEEAHGLAVGAGGFRGVACRRVEARELDPALAPRGVGGDGLLERVDGLVALAELAAHASARALYAAALGRTRTASMSALRASSCLRVMP